MKRIGPSLLLITLAGILLAAPSISFPALGQTEAVGKATPSDAEPVTDENGKNETIEKDIHNEDIGTEDKNEEDIADGDIENETAGDEGSRKETTSTETTGRDSNKELSSETPSSESTPVQNRLADSYPAATSSDAALEVKQVIAAGYPEVLTVELNGAKEAVSELLKSSQYQAHISAAVILSDNNRAVYPISYDLELLNQAGPGLVLIPGSIEVPENVSISPELDGAVLHVFLSDPASPNEMPAVRCEMEISHVLLRESDTEEASLLKKLINQDFYLYLEDGYYWFTKMAWDLSDIRFGMPGTYKIRAVPPQESGILLPESLPPITADVIIQDDNRFMLGPPDFESSYLEVRWTKETPDISLIRCYYAVGDGDWQEDTDGNLINLGTQSLTVFYYNLEQYNTSYYFQLSYDGMDSNILEIYLSDEETYFKFHEGDRDGGDREEQAPPKLEQAAPTDPSTDETASPETSGPDAGEPETSAPVTSTPDETQPTEPLPSDGSSGGNSGGSSGSSSGGSSGGGSHTATHSGFAAGGPGVTAPSDIVPEANPSIIVPDAAAYAAYNSEYAGIGTVPESIPDAPSADPVSSVVLEEETEDYVVLSGNRLKKLLEHNPGQPVTIRKHRIQLSIPTDTGLFSHINGQSLFRMELLSLSDNTISVELLMDGVPLTNLPPLTITMPWKTSREDVNLSVTGADGTVLGNAQVQDGILTFTTLQTGTFTIKEISPDTASHTDNAVTAEPFGSGNTDRSYGTGDAPADTPASRPQEQTKMSRMPWAPILYAVPALALSALYFWRRAEHNPGKKGGGI